MPLQSDTKNRWSTKISFFYKELLQLKSCFSFVISFTFIFIFWFSFTFILMFLFLYFCKYSTNFEIIYVELIWIYNYLYSRSILLITLTICVTIFIAFTYDWFDEELNIIFIIVFLLIFFIFIISTKDGPVSADHLSSCIFIEKSYKLSKRFKLYKSKYFDKLNDYNKIYNFFIAVVYCFCLFLIIIHPYRIYTYGNYTRFFNICLVLLPISDLGHHTYVSYRLLLSLFTTAPFLFLFLFLFTFASTQTLANKKEVTILPPIVEVPENPNPLDPDNIFGLQSKFEE